MHSEPSPYLPIYSFIWALMTDKNTSDISTIYTCNGLRPSNPDSSVNGWDKRLALFDNMYIVKVVQGTETAMDGFMIENLRGCKNNNTDRELPRVDRASLLYSGTQSQSLLQ